MTKFKKSGKIIFVASIVIFLAAACNKGQLKSANQPVSGSVNQQTQQQAITPNVNPPPTPKGQTQTRQNAGGPDYFPNSQQPVSATATASSTALAVPTGPTVNVTQLVYGGPNLYQIHFTVSVGESAFDLLKSTHQVQAKDYGPGMGEFVQSIDGVTPGSGKFWKFYVNGQSSNVGASSYVLRDGDKIEWKIDTINNE